MRFNMSQLDTCKRYLYADLHGSPSRYSAAFGGHFGKYLKEQFDIERLPYGITIVDMLTKRMIKPDLLIKFPQNANGKKFLNFYNKGISFYTLFHSNKGWEPESFLHPYDILNYTTWQCKRVPSIFKPEKFSHDEMIRIPYEAYFRYWKVYILAEALSDGYDQIELFLAPKKGIDYLEKRFQEVNTYWEKTYEKVFDRLSYYQTAQSILYNHKTPKRSVSEEENRQYLKALEFIQKTMLHYTSYMMEEDIEKLIKLFHKWEGGAKNGGKYYAKGLDLLRSDIYDLTAWLAITTDQTLDECFALQNGWRHYSGSNNLKHILCFESFKLERIFIYYYIIELCNGNTKTILKTDERQAKVLFDRLLGLSDYNSSFRSWVRILFDLQNQLGGNMKAPISFEEIRIVDYLRNFAITTEALIRQMIVDIYPEVNKEFSIKGVFHKLQDEYKQCKNPTYRNALEIIINEYGITNLKDIDDLTEKNKSIFSKVNSLSLSISKNAQTQFAVHSVLSFMTARNYAAHHFCRDHELNNLIDEQPCQILHSCVASVVIIDTIVQEIMGKPIVQYAVSP